LMMVQDFKSTYGYCDNLEPDVFVTRDKKPENSFLGTHVDKSYTLSSSFWYVILDVNLGTEVQYGFISNTDHAMKVTIADWRECIIRCWDDIVTDGYMQVPRVK
jgi:hypothetical protein